MDALDTRQLDDGVVAYRIFPVAGGGGVDLAELRRSCLAEAAAAASGHAWNEQPFRLAVKPASLCGKVPAHLAGRVSIGECVHDEWMILRCLCRITDRLASAVLAAEVADADGQFVLAEAADHLPGWLRPDLAGNRAWLRQGRLHLVTASPGNRICLAEALARLRGCNCCSDGNDAGSADDGIVSDPRAHACLADRAASALDAQPAVHRARVLLSERLAAALTARPQLLGAVAAAFLRRDAADARRCRFPDGSGAAAAAALVPAVLVFNRCLYAQLMSQAEAGYRPDRRSAQWTSAAAEAEAASAGSADAQRALRLGLMLTHGAAILTARCRDGDAGDADEELDGRELTRLYETAPAVATSGEPLPASDPDDWLTVTADQLDDFMARLTGRQPINLADGSSGGAASRAFADFLRAQSGLEGVETAKSATQPEATSGGAAVAIDADGLVASLNRIFDELGVEDNDEDDVEDSEGDVDDADDDIESADSDDALDDDDEEVETDSPSRRRLLMRRLMRQMDAELSGTNARQRGSGKSGADLERAYVAELAIRPGPLSGLASAAGIAPKAPRRPP